MLQWIAIIVALLTSYATAAPHPQPDRGDHVQHDGSIIYPSSDPTIWTATEWSSWSPSPYNPTPQPSTYQVTSPSPTAQTPPTFTPTATLSSIASASSTEAVPTGPCGSVAVLAAAQTNASSTAAPTVPAQLAYECLNSIPFNQSAALQLLDAIDPYLQWQTTFEYVKDPPAEYAEKVQPSYDFYATWEAIKANASAGTYQSEYEFGFAVYSAALKVHDGHFQFNIDSVFAIFGFGRPFTLVSVSSDGISDPQPYVYSDIVSSLSGDSSFTPSPITEIDGEDAIQYLLAWSEYGFPQDPDAMWNNLFWEAAQAALGPYGNSPGLFAGGGAGWVYPGPATTLKFANGTTVMQENYASVLASFDNITSGEDVYMSVLAVSPDATQNLLQIYSSDVATTATTAAFSTYTFATSAGATSAGASSTAAISTVVASSTAVEFTSYSVSSSTPSPTPGYPTPFISGAEAGNAGFFLDAPGYEDVAVLAVRTFVDDSFEETNFQSVNTYFIETAAAMGKTKLIIDLSGNGGGTILQGYDLFKQLFPSMLPYGASRYRAHEAFNLLGEQTSYLAGLAPLSLDYNVTNGTFQDIESSPFDYRVNANVDYEPFTSWAEMYGPDSLGPQPDNFSSIIRWNLSFPLIPVDDGGIYVSGYLNRSNITTQPFAAENIIIVTDGYCASTCTIFTELMTSQGGVKTIALGGRSQPGIMQAIGGTKGANDEDSYGIFSMAFEVLGASNSSLLDEWEPTIFNKYTLLPFERSYGISFNVRNAYLPGDDTPLQFVYQPADCRILYTPAMIVDETAIWKTVADSVWGGGAGNACVAGGFDADGTNKTSSAGTRDVKERQMHAPRRDTDYHALLDEKLAFPSGYSSIGTGGLLGRYWG